MLNFNFIEVSDESDFYGKLKKRNNQKIAFLPLNQKFDIKWQNLLFGIGLASLLYCKGPLINSSANDFFLKTCLSSSILKDEDKQFEILNYLYQWKKNQESCNPWVLKRNLTVL